MSRGGLLGGLAVSGDPDEVAALARELRRIADHVAECNGQLSAVAGNVDWRGSAADAYRDKLGSLPDELEKVHTSYQGVSWALRSYETSLRDLQARSRRAATRARDAQGRIEAVARAKRSGQPHDPRWHAEEEAAHGDLRGAKQEAGRVHGEFEDAVRTCCNRIRAASDAGMHNSFGSAFDRYVVHDVGGFVWDVATAAPRAVIDLGPALWEFAQDPSMEKFARVVDDLTTIVATAAIFFPGLAPIALGLSALQVGTDLATHHWEKAAVDGLFLGVAGVGKVAGRAGGLGQRVARLDRDAAAVDSPQAQIAFEGKVGRQLGELHGAGPGGDRSLLGAAVRSPLGWSTQRQSLAERFLHHPVARTSQLVEHPGATLRRWFDNAWTPHGDALPVSQGRPAALYYHRVELVADRLHGEVEPVADEALARREEGRQHQPPPMTGSGGGVW